MMKWTDGSHGISTISIVKGFLCCTVVKIADGIFMVRVNGKEVQKSYSSQEEAKSIAIKAAKKLIEEATQTLGGIKE